MLDQLAVTRAELHDEISKRKLVEQELQEFRQFVTEKMGRPSGQEATGSTNNLKPVRPTSASHKDGVSVSVQDLEVRGVPNAVRVASAAWVECTLNGQSQRTQGPAVVIEGNALRWQGQGLLFTDSLRVLRKPLQLSLCFFDHGGRVVSLSYHHISIQDAILAKKCELQPERGQQSSVEDLKDTRMVVAVSLGGDNKTGTPPQPPSSTRRPSLVELAQGIEEEAATIRVAPLS